ncbi:predicted protein [Botrytis cinerea T4]|uniref:Uncharacterized protein n=1 Tax=Botryotinia fuckeliana (strain T4) TaxID=999810 RepID=G2YCW9_BOTF4|nr:predicted protein [Botrytis cinerea T4]
MPRNPMSTESFSPLSLSIVYYLDMRPAIRPSTVSRPFRPRSSGRKPQTCYIKIRMHTIF